MGNVKVRCDNCGKVICRKEYQVKKYKNHFCGNVCWGIWQSKHLKGKNNPAWNGGGKEKVCPVCGKIFKFERRQKERKYCSHECYSKAISGEDNPQWNRTKRICLTCGKEFEIKASLLKRGKGNYCSLSCARKAKKIPKHHTKPELAFIEICNKYNLPFKYTGNGSFWIHNINPDFVECNGKKIAVEIFGDYWHSPLLKRNMRYNQTYRGRKKILKKYGWKLIVLWESDLLRGDAEAFVLSKLEKEKVKFLTDR